VLKESPGWIHKPDRIVVITVLLCPGQVDFKGAPLSGSTLNRDSAPMGLGDVFDDGKAKTGSAQLSASCLVNTIKPLKDSGKMFFLYATALVMDADYNLILCLARPESDHTVHVTILDGVIEEVYDGLFKECRIDLRRYCLFARKLNFYILGSCFGDAELNRSLKHILNPPFSKNRFFSLSVLLNFRQGEKIFNDSLEAIYMFFNNVKKPLGLLRLLYFAIVERLNESLDSLLRHSGASQRIP
jgi:hypothetical protein